MTFKESDTLSGGDNITVFDTPFGKVRPGLIDRTRAVLTHGITRNKNAKPSTASDKTCTSVEGCM